MTVCSSSRSLSSPDLDAWVVTKRSRRTGVGGGEGAFIMVTFWLVEAMARVNCLLAVQPW